jgi:hypothetical protein
MPAKGFADGFVYSDLRVSQISMSATGHIAFIGQADSNVESVSSVWAGLQDSFTSIIKENDLIQGLAANTVFDKVSLVANGGGQTEPGQLVINDNGDVLMRARLKGAYTGDAFISHTKNGNQFIIRNGQNDKDVPGIQAFLLDPGAAFSTAGAVISGLITYTDSSSNSILGKGLWFWDHTELKLIAVGFFDGKKRFEQQAISYLPSECFITGIGSFGTKAQINNSGDVLFFASIGGGVNCPQGSSTPLLWKNGNITKVIHADDPVPALAGLKFNFNFRYPMTLSESGDIAFNSVIENQFRSVTRQSAWIKKRGGDLQFLAIEGETLKDFPVKKIIGNGFLLNAPLEGIHGSYLLPSLFSGTPTEIAYLRGQSITMPYSDLSQIGESSLDLLVKQNDVPPEGSSSEFFTGFSNPQINQNNDLVFLAGTADALKPVLPKIGLWHIDPAGVINPVLLEGQTEIINGAEEVVRFIRDYQLSDNNQVMMAVDYSDLGSAIQINSL